MSEMDALNELLANFELAEIACICEFGDNEIADETQAIKALKEKVLNYRTVLGKAIKRNKL